jgi:hypothetical protein
MIGNLIYLLLLYHKPDAVYWYLYRLTLISEDIAVVIGIAATLDNYFSNYMQNFGNIVVIFIFKYTSNLGFLPVTSHVWFSSCIFYRWETEVLYSCKSFISFLINFEARKNFNVSETDMSRKSAL